MNKKIAVLLTLVVMVFITSYFILDNHPIPRNTNINKNTQSQNNNPGGEIKFSNTPYWNYAYLISNANLNSQAKTALSGFKREKKTLPDGSTKITLKALSPYYKDQTYILKNKEKLYFIETSLGDDPQFKEYNLGDDIAVKVDSKGYILKGD